MLLSRATEGAVTGKSIREPIRDLIRESIRDPGREPIREAIRAVEGVSGSDVGIGRERNAVNKTAAPAME